MLARKERSKTVHARKGDKEVTLADFRLVHVIGRGAYGKVYLVQKSVTQEVYAMKALTKHQILERDMLASLELEKKIGMQIQDHPFLVGLDYVF